MNLPTKESIEFAKKSAEKIAAIKIEAEIFMDFDVDYQHTNKVDREFTQDLIEGKDLSDAYITEYIDG
ncbi:hypothetical protein BHECKSOX2_520 [Bathymodiolus heckerae thiotrophic gill symbiont]|uniref:hypothetical protein n=1 Tax=Bathymodiolus heckerae thiotrophic gill symbiont TaxID=1052212 RepID=UPI0010AF6317|nr:hypothetical protein [Bathymodiolus heckerae thiotrophic gill symbiont]SMN13457.1 hypothetical protein BHECKSOX2_520 [Bathymodiolus heckerae thiotrophic gill symbiont]